jgi:CIC family chloride channel protein
MRTADAGEYAVGFLLLLAAGKIAATSLTIAIGGSGGIFAPTLYVGAMLGAAYGAVAAGMLPGLAGPGEGYALAGMAAVFGAAARAPITAVVIMYELTGDYAVPPMMLAVTLAAGAAALVETDTLYTLTLKRRGVSDPVVGGWPAPASAGAPVAGPPPNRIAGARRRPAGAAPRSASGWDSRTGNHRREPPGTA